jgi:hypothetical protein
MACSSAISKFQGKTIKKQKKSIKVDRIVSIDLLLIRSSHKIKSSSEAFE